MVLYVDTASKRLVQSLTSDRITPAPSFMQGDNEPLEIHLLEIGANGVYDDRILDPNHDTLRVGIGRFKNDPKLLTIGSVYIPLANGGCILTLPLNTVEIETALGTSASLDAYLEIEYSTSSGQIITVLQTACKVKNDLIEGFPSIEIRDEFYTKEQANVFFLKRADFEIAKTGLNQSISLKEPKDAMLAPTGGWARIPRSATALKISAPLSLAITFNATSFGEANGTHFFNSRIYPGPGIAVLYNLANKRFEVIFFVVNTMYTTNFFYANESMIGLHTLVTTISADTRPVTGGLVMRLWFDGVEKTHYVYAGAIWQDPTLPNQDDYTIGGIGSYANNRTAAMQGSYSHAMIFDRLLTSAEVADYNNGNDPLNPLFSLKDVNAPQWRDSSGNGHHATLYNGNKGTKIRDMFVMSDIGIWTAAGTKYLLSSTDKVIPDNCRFNLILKASADCSVSVKNGAGGQYANVMLYAGVPLDVGNFINTSDGKLSFTPNISAVTINSNLEIRKF